MMLSRDEIKRNFLDFVNQFDNKDERISLKILHSQNVASIADDIATSLNLDPHFKDLVYVAALFHDIGRFDQARTKTFIDSKENDHATIGDDFLFGGDNLKRFVGDIDDNDRLLLHLAIINHNKLMFNADNDKQKIICDIIRDADKLDFFRVFTVNSFEVVFEASKETIRASKISNGISSAFFKHETIDFSKRETPADVFIANIALPFGLVYPCSKKRALTDGYVIKMLDFEFEDKETQETYKRMKKEILDFLSNDIN